MTTENEKTTETFTIPETQMGYFRERMGELAARCAKLAMTVVVGFEVLRTFQEQVGTLIDPNDGSLIPLMRTYSEVRVTGMAPRLEGWALRGRFDFEAIPGKTMRAMVPGFECPAEFHDVDPERCDACGHQRRRNDTFLLQHEDGRFVVVGRTCLKDYLGHVSPEHVARMAEILAELSSVGDEEGSFWGARVPSAWDLHAVIAIACYSVRTEGWAPSRADASTREDVFGLLIPSNNRQVEASRQRRLAEVTDADRIKAANAIDWAANVDASRSDYLFNLQGIVEANVVTAKAMGIAVSLVTAYDRAMEREIKRRETAKRHAASDYVGKIKERLDLEGLTVEMVRSTEGYYGTTTIVKFVDADGNVFTWFASNGPDVEPGDVFSLRGTVKKHEEFRGVKQTVLTRCANLERTADGPARQEDAA